MDFIGFTFNGYHSSEMHFVRTSNGSRYEENLIPAFQDRTIAVPGGDGTYFFDSFYTNRTFTIQIAFDSMTEEDLRKFHRVFNTKEMGPLIFDETPYKAYVAKVQNPPQLKYICFDENKVRRYKGEGTIQFICYYPYARSIYKYTDQYDEEYNRYMSYEHHTPSSNDGSLYSPGSGVEGYTKQEWINQWQPGSGMITSTQASSVPSHNLTANSGENIYLYNPGDVETDFLAFYQTPGSKMDITVKLTNRYSEEIGKLKLKDVFRTSIHDNYICLNSKTNLIEGCEESSLTTRTGTLYNNYISSGDFFKIPMSSSTSDIYTFNSTPSSFSCVKFDYDYLYY